MDRRSHLTKPTKSIVKLSQAQPAPVAVTSSTAPSPGSRPASKAATSTRGRPSKDILDWLTVPGMADSGVRRSGRGFMGCCPCDAALDERACTPPWCFSYRYLDWMLTVAVVLLASWGTAYSALGTPVGPGSAFFNSTVVVIVSYAVGWFGQYQFNLPAVMGMYLVSLTYRNVPGLWNLSEPLDPALVTAVKSLLLTIVFIKAGLYFDVAVFRSYGLTILVLGCLPCLCEAVVVGLAAYALLDITAAWAFCVGFIWCGVSPILLSLALVSLANQGYGNKTGILSILLAATTIDNTLTVTIFAVLSVSSVNTAEYGSAMLISIVQLLLSVSVGFILGLILAFVPHKHSRHGLLARFSLLFLSGCCVNVACHSFQVDTAAFICHVTAASVMVNCWRVMEWHEGANPFREVFEMLWQACQPVMLFLVGISIDFLEMEVETVWRVCVLFVLGVVVRCPVTYTLTRFSRKPGGQRLLMSLAWASKGMLQTTLGSLALRTVTDDPVLKEKISTTISLGVLLGCFVITLFIKFLGPRLLPKSD